MTDEARRLLRYVFPGVAAAGLILLLWMFVFPGHHQLPRTLSGAGGGGAAIAGAIGAIVAGGALGYVASQVYFFLHWHGPKWFGPNDHRSIATFIRSEVKPWTEPEAPHLEESRRAWVTLTAWWFLTAGVDPRVESARGRTTTLMDHAHSAGVFACAIAMAGLSWAAIVGLILDPPCGRVLIGLAITVAIGLLLLRNSYATRVMFDHLVDVTARQAILVRNEELSAHRKPGDAQLGERSEPASGASPNASYGAGPGDGAA